MVGLKCAWALCNSETIRLSEMDRGTRIANVSTDGFPTVYRAGATPVPIPNTEVKPCFGDGTAGYPRWESSATVGSLETASGHGLGAVFFWMALLGLGPPFGHGAPGLENDAH